MLAEWYTACDLNIQDQYEICSCFLLYSRFLCLVPVRIGRYITGWWTWCTRSPVICDCHIFLSTNWDIWRMQTGKGQSLSLNQQVCAVATYCIHHHSYCMLVAVLVITTIANSHARQSILYHISVYFFIYSGWAKKKPQLCTSPKLVSSLHLLLHHIPCSVLAKAF